MAKERTTAQNLVARGDWRPGKHADRVNAVGVADVSEDSMLWDVMLFWHEQLELARKTVAVEGQTIVNAGEQTQQHPSLKIAVEASKRIESIAATFGVGPMNRAKLGVEASPDSSVDDPDAIPERYAPRSA
jgi:phage terminase small subunit